MDDFWVMLLTTLPFVAGAGLGIYEITLRLTGRPGQSQQIRTWMLMTTLAAILTGAVALLLTPDVHSTSAITWLPNAGAMQLHLGQSGLFAALVTTAVALGLLLITGAPAPMTGSLLLIACGSANMAFISGHFVSRYVALEIVGLCIALLPLAEVKGSEGSYLSRRVYLILRLGDAGFFTAILMLLNHTGTLEIATALEKGASVSNPALAWIVAGLILAVWVKMGLWPFHNWLGTGKLLSPVANVWVYMTVMPNLGLYLLYRIQPLLVANAQPNILLSWAGLVAACAAVILAVYRAGFPESLSYINAVQGGLIVFWAASGQLNFLPCLLFLSLLRIALTCIGVSKTRRATTVLISVTGTAIVSFWTYAFIGEIEPMSLGTKLLAALVLLLNGVWTLRSVRYQHATHPAASSTPKVLPVEVKSGQSQSFVLCLRELLSWAYRFMRQDALDKLLHGMASRILGVGRWLYRVVEQDLLEQMLRGITVVTLGSGRWLYNVVENTSLEGFLQWITRTVQAMSRRLQKVHTGKLRLNLIWVTLCIIVVLVTVVF